MSKIYSPLYTISICTFVYFVFKTYSTPLAELGGLLVLRCPPPFTSQEGCEKRFPVKGFFNVLNVDYIVDVLDHVTLN